MSRLFQRKRSVVSDPAEARDTSHMNTEVTLSKTSDSSLLDLTRIYRTPCHGFEDLELLMQWAGSHSETNIIYQYLDRKVICCTKYLIM